MNLNNKKTFPQAFAQERGLKSSISFCSGLSFLMLVLQLAFSPSSYAEHAKNFTEAKKMARTIWAEEPYTLYCGCKFDKQSAIDFKSCGYVPGDMRRAKRVEWEHIVPASWLGRQRPCWREPLCTTKKGKKYKGRKCCEKIDSVFRKAHADLYNLAPAIGEVNAARRDYRFSVMGLTPRDNSFNGCNLLISQQSRAVEPSEAAKGMIARATSLHG
jgi:deoxyribonuclease I